MKELFCSDGHEFNEDEVKEQWQGRYVCPYCWPEGFLRPIIGFRQFKTKEEAEKYWPDIKGETINAAEDLNLRERKNDQGGT